MAQNAHATLSLIRTTNTFYPGLEQQLGEHVEYRALMERLGYGPEWPAELARRATSLSRYTGVTVAD